MVQTFRVEQGPLNLNGDAASRYTGVVWVHDDTTGNVLSDHHVSHVEGFTYNNESCSLNFVTKDGKVIAVTVTSETLDAMIEAREGVRVETWDWARGEKR